MPDSIADANRASAGGVFTKMIGLRHDDYKLVELFLQAFPEALGGERMLVAVSGGSDSTALLLLLSDVRRLHAVTAPFSVVYVDHGQRTKTDDESALVAAAARRSGADFESVTVDHPERNSEAELRSQRYEALHDVAERVGAAWILTGHTRDDQIETFLLRLIRGAGRLGLSGIPTRRDRIVRPLLGIRRSDLRAYLDRRGVDWIDDPSNATDRYTRNRLRADAIPAIQRAFGASALEHLPELARRLRCEEDFLEGEAARYRGLVVVDGGRSLDLSALAEVPAALQARLIRNWLGTAAGGAAIGMRQLAEVEKLIASRQGSAAIAIAGIRLERCYDRLSALEHKGDCLAQPFLYKVRAGDRGHFVGPNEAWEIRIDPHPDGRPRRARGPGRDTLDIRAESLGNSANLRPAAPGDRIDLAGHGMRKVRDIMTDRRLPRAVRAAWPVLATEAELVLWVPGLAVAREVTAADGAGDRLRLEWKGLHI